MLLGKNFLVAAAISAVISVNSQAEDLVKVDKNVCSNLFREFNVSPEIKSSKGWQRVKYKDSVESYIENKNNLTTQNKNVLMDCLISSSDDLALLTHTIGGR